MCLRRLKSFGARRPCLNSPCRGLNGRSQGNGSSRRQVTSENFKERSELHVRFKHHSHRRQSSPGFRCPRRRRCRGTWRHGVRGSLPCIRRSQSGLKLPRVHGEPVTQRPGLRHCPTLYFDGGVHRSVRCGRRYLCRNQQKPLTASRSAGPRHRSWQHRVFVRDRDKPGIRDHIHPHCLSRNEALWLPSRFLSRRDRGFGISGATDTTQHLHGDLGNPDRTVDRLAIYRWDHSRFPPCCHDDAIHQHRCPDCACPGRHRPHRNKGHTGGTIYVG